MITIKFFASLREELGCSEMALDSDQSLTVMEVWNRVAQGKPLPVNVLMAVNMEYAHKETLVQDGYEVAFFPPVTGG
jgi:molybdopterin synthase sulfur carrier subunit